MVVPPILLALGSGLLFTVLGVSYKRAAALGCRTSAFLAVYLTAAALLSALALPWDRSLWSSRELWVLGVFLGVNAVVCIRLLMAANRSGPASVSWLFINLSLLVPVGLSVAAMSERLLPADWIALSAFAVMAVLLVGGLRRNGEVSRSNTAHYWSCIAAVFVLNGLGLFGSKLKASLFPDQNTAALMLILFSTGAAVSWWQHLRQTTHWRPYANEWNAGLVAGIACGCANFLLIASAVLPAAVVYPVSQGASLIGGVVLTTVLYREAITPAKVAALLLGCAVLMCAVWRESVSSWAFG